MKWFNIVLLIIFILSIVFLFWNDNYQRDKCTKKSGEYHGGRGSYCVKHDSIIK